MNPREPILLAVEAFVLGVRSERTKLVGRLDELAERVHERAAFAWLDGFEAGGGDVDRPDEERAALAAECGEAAEELVVDLVEGGQEGAAA